MNRVDRPRAGIIFENWKSILQSNRREQKKMKKWMKWNKFNKYDTIALARCAVAVICVKIKTNNKPIRDDERFSILMPCRERTSKKSVCINLCALIHSVGRVLSVRMRNIHLFILFVLKFRAVCGITACLAIGRDVRCGFLCAHHFPSATV